MRKVCPKDSKHSECLAQNDKYCYICGTKLKEKDMTCVCGKDYGYMDNFCPECGRPLK